MITPINGHILIEPLSQNGFMQSQKETFEEIGTVVEDYSVGNTDSAPILYKGDKVYFDAWLASKYPSGKQGEFYWLVKYEDVRAVEYGT